MTPTPSPEPAQPPSRRWSRRRLLRGAGAGGAALVGGGVWAGWRRDAAAEVDPRVVTDPYCDIAPGTAAAGAQPVAASAATATHYGHAAAAPLGMAADALDALTVPPPFDGRQGVTREHELVVTEEMLEVADGTWADAWTFGGTAPGPILRATEGDTLRVHLRNATGHPHNLHLHGRHAPTMDGWEPIPPGESFTYELAMGPVGLHPYHCHVAPLAEHVARGLYGAVIVDPPGGRPDAHEFVLVLGGWDLDGDRRNELVTWNGVAGFFHAHPITVPVGEPVRVYLVNMLEYEPVGSFHLHAQTFDCYRSGTRPEPDEHTDTVTLGMGERAVLEFTLPERGRYMFHPHQHHLADAGAMGWFAAV